MTSIPSWICAAFIAGMVTGCGLAIFGFILPRSPIAHAEGITAVDTRDPSRECVLVISSPIGREEGIYCRKIDQVVDEKEGWVIQ